MRRVDLERERRASRIVGADVAHGARAAVEDSRARRTGVAMQPDSAVNQPRSGRASLTTCKRTPSTVTGSSAVARSDEAHDLRAARERALRTARSRASSAILLRATRDSSDGSLKRLRGTT